MALRIFLLPILICVFFTFLSYSKSEQINPFDEIREVMMRELNGIKWDDTFHNEQILRKIINEYSNNEGVLFAYYKLLGVNRMKYRQGEITFEEYNKLNSRVAEEGIKTYNAIMKLKNMKLESALSEYYLAIFYEVLNEWDKAENIYKLLVVNKRDLLSTPTLSLCRVQLRQNKYNVTKDIFFKLSSEHQKEILRNFPKFYDYLLKQNLVSETLKLSSLELEKIKRYSDLGWGKWEYLINVKKLNIEDEKLKNKFYSLIERFREIIVFMEIYFSEHGFYPDELSKVFAIPNTKSINDTFSSDTLHYNLGDLKVTIWSNGPDGDNDNAAIPYDPTNGTLSNGDIILQKITVERKLRGDL